jgi:hypothetical protein
MFTPALKKGSIELLILSLLEHQARHGYEIGKMIRSLSDDRLSFSASSRDRRLNSTTRPPCDVSLLRTGSSVPAFSDY